MTILSIIKILLSAFFSFIIVISFISNFFSKNTLFNMSRTKQFPSISYPISSFDVTGVENIIISRNIFNITGEIPSEDFELSPEELTSKNFYKIPCAPKSESLPVEVVGIIYTGNSKTNLVTVQDPQVEGADVYNEGDTLLDHNDYSVYRIVNSNNVEFRYGTKKICRALSSRDSSIKEFEQISEDSDQTPGEVVELSQEYVNSELGKGLSKIITTARIVPSLDNGIFEGFKVFDVAPNSLFEKIGIMNGDVVTQVNNQKLTDPSKGFVIYDSFQYEHQITFTIKRGTQTITRKVIIK